MSYSYLKIYILNTQDYRIDMCLFPVYTAAGTTGQVKLQLASYRSTCGAQVELHGERYLRMDVIRNQALHHVLRLSPVSHAHQHLHNFSKTSGRSMCIY